MILEQNGEKYLRMVEPGPTLKEEVEMKAQIDQNKGYDNAVNTINERKLWVCKLNNNNGSREI